MSDLKERLRDRDKNRHGFYGPVPFNRDGEEAAARIEELEAKLATARNDALEEAATVAFDHTPDKFTTTLASYVTGRTIEAAIRALKSTNPI